MRLYWIPFVILALLPSGCGSDYQLHQIELQPEDPVAAPAVPLPPVLPPPPTLPPPEDPPNPPTSNWPPDVGDVPDLYFAIAWSDWPCHWGDQLWADGVGPSGPTLTSAESEGSPIEQPSDLWALCDARNVAVVNMFGEVVDEFLPEGLENSVGVEFLQLVNAGHGQFLHVFQRYDDGDTFDTSTDGFYPGNSWQAWRGDSYTGEQLLVANWDYENQNVWLPQAGRHLDVGGSINQLQLGVLPTDPNLLVTWQGQNWCAPESTVQPLQVTHMFDGSVLNQGWQPDQFLPEEVHELMDNPAGWNMDLSLNEDGELSALFGVTTGGCSGLPEDPATLQLVSWTPTQQESWYAPTETGWQPQAATYAGWRGTGALNLLGDNGVARWRVTAPTAVAEGTLSSAMDGYRPGPLIDPQGPTFTVVGTDPQSWDGDSLDFYHQGQVVWSIDTLKFGLQERRVFFADVILLSQRPEEDGD